MRKTRPILAALFVAMGLSAVASAQSRSNLPSWAVSPRAGSPAEGWPSDPLPQFSVLPVDSQRTSPLPEIGLPLPPIGLRPPGERRHESRHRSPGYFPVPYMVMVVPSVEPVTVPQPIEPVVTGSGTLVLDVQPAAAQVFIDGFYAGSAADFGGSRGGAFLDAGPHSVEMVAPGHDPLRFDVRIVPNQALVYRGELSALQPLRPAPPTTKTPTTIYMIPGCYVGNVPPKDAHLPATCDLSDAVMFQM